VPIKLLLVDDQNLVKMGICSLLEICGDIEVVAQLDDGTGVIDSIEKLAPDIMILDIRMPKMDGVEVLAKMKELNIFVPTLILSTFDEHDLVLKCIKLGAKGYLRKDVSLESLLNAVNSVVEGKLWIQPAITNQLLHNKNLLNEDYNFSLESVEALTEGEVQVLRLVAAGYSNNEISEALHKSPGTVRNLISFILAKLHVRDRTRAVLKALELGLIK